MRDLAPDGGSAKKELEVHAEVLELLALSVAHDVPGARVRLHREALLVPSDRFGLLCQRGAKASESSGALRELVGRLVVLVKAHRPSFTGFDGAGPAHIIAPGALWKHSGRSASVA